MRSHSHFLRCLAPLGLLLASASAGKIQKDDLKVPEDYAKHRETVKQMFLDSYGAYKEHAWGHDEVRVRIIPATLNHALRVEYVLFLLSRLVATATQSGF